MKLRDTNYDNSQTGCCASIDLDQWDEKEVMWEGKRFVQDRIFAIMHMPINFGAVMGRLNTKVENAEAYPEDVLWISDEKSAWGSDVYVAVDKEVPDCKNVKLSGTFLTKVFEGPYKNMRSWIKEMKEYVHRQEKKVKKIYFFYTTCPKCSKTLGKNYVVLFAQVD
jgi:effector-binding domain-containing protein